MFFISYELPKPKANTKGFFCVRDFMRNTYKMFKPLLFSVFNLEMKSTLRCEVGTTNTSFECFQVSLLLIHSGITGFQ
jgi:hypothetical protein